MSGEHSELDLPEWLHRELVREYATETEPWARERISRVQTQLNAARRGKKALSCTILWCTTPLAFTQGSYIYIARRLLERLPSDDLVALVLAHEAAHHDLGHFDLFAELSGWLPKSSATTYLAAMMHHVAHWTYGPQRENDADDYAVRLCARAGFRVDAAVEALQILENIVLDNGDVSGVYGPENLLDPTDPNRGSKLYQMQEWAWSHLRGYHPLRTRLERSRTLARAILEGRDVK